MSQVMLLTLAEAGKRMAISQKAVRRLINDGRLAYVDTTGTAKGHRIDPADLERYIKRSKKVMGGADSWASDTAKIRDLGKYRTNRTSAGLDAALQRAKKQETC